MDDICRICSTKYPSSKWKRWLFGRDNTLLMTLCGILGCEVSKSDHLPSTVCSSCQNKLAKVMKLENELKTIKDWISRSFARSASQFVESGVDRVINISKRAMGASPEGKPPSKKQDVTASPLGVSMDVEATSDHR